MNHHHILVFWFETKVPGTLMDKQKAWTLWIHFNLVLTWVQSANYWYFLTMFINLFIYVLIAAIWRGSISKIGLFIRA